jgi:hypothetical protein
VSDLSGETGMKIAAFLPVAMKMLSVKSRRNRKACLLSSDPWTKTLAERRHSELLSAEVDRHEPAAQSFRNFPIRACAEQRILRCLPISRLVRWIRTRAGNAQ